MIANIYAPTRRSFLQQTGAILAMAACSSKLHAGLAGLQKQVISGDTSLKFHADGTARAFAGNTILCHLPAQGALHDALATLHESLARSSFHQKLGLTPIDSYHMTAFSGPTDQKRSREIWPSYVPFEASIEDCNRLVAEHMQQAHLHGELPLRMKFDKDAALQYPTACSLRLRPVDEAASRNVQSLRAQIAEAYGFRGPDFEAYGFHITISYQLQPFTQAERSEYLNLLSHHLPLIENAAPILELGNPEYCTFQDMRRFDIVKLLTCV